MTPEAKRALCDTVRGLRARLLDDLTAATEAAYRLSVRAQDAGLDAATAARRKRLEDWTQEQARAAAPSGKGRGRAARDAAAFRAEAVKQAAYTLLNRLVLLRLLEAPGPGDSADPDAKPLRHPALLTGGWASRAYQDFRQLAPDLCAVGSRDDASEGYAFLLRLTFEDLARDLPGLYGPAGVADLVPVPASTLRHMVDALDAPALAGCWRDDMTLGWVYQYWNDPEREALDDKLNSGGKVTPHEIASKTQMFTERYMVEWLLHNSLGQQWLAICEQNGWTPEVVADGTLDALEVRRQDWREQRDRGEVALDALMPLETEQEERWKYWVKQPPLTPLSRSGRGAGGVDATAASRRVGKLLPGEDRPHPLAPSPNEGEGGQEVTTPKVLLQAGSIG